MLSFVFFFVVNRHSFSLVLVVHSILIIYRPIIDMYINQPLILGVVISVRFFRIIIITRILYMQTYSWGFTSAKKQKSLELGVLLKRVRKHNHKTVPQSTTYSRLNVLEYLFFWIRKNRYRYRNCLIMDFWKVEKYKILLFNVCELN